MNPYRNYMEKSAFVGQMLTQGMGHIARGLQSPVVQQAGRMLGHPAVQAGIAVGVPMAIGAGRAVGGAMVDKFKLERSWSSLQREIQATPTLAKIDQKLLREVFMTIAQASPEVAGNPMLAIAALKQWASNNAGMRQFDLGSFAALQGIQSAASRRGGPAGSSPFGDAQRFMPNPYPSADFKPAARSF